jgi:hypothetical protein
MHVPWWVRSGKVTTAHEGKLLVTKHYRRIGHLRAGQAIQACTHCGKSTGQRLLQLSKASCLSNMIQI